MKNYSISILLLIFFCFSCKESEKERITRLVHEWQGKEIKFPGNMVFTTYVTDTLDWQIPESDYKILVYVDSIGCTDCKLQLDKWKNMIEQVDILTGGKIPFLFFFHSGDYREINYILKRDQFDLPVCLDKDDIINKLNRFPSEASFQTFLLDKNNKVVLLGNPIHNLAVKELYLNQIVDRIPAAKKASIKTTAKVEFTEYDLGTLKRSENKTAVFNIHNTGENPLVIIDAITTCGCANPTYDKEPAIPGGVLQVNVVYSPKGGGFFDETVTLKCNTESWIKLKIKGQVI